MPNHESRFTTMKIKRFVAPDMRTAFAMVRQEHGPDAVILSNRMTDDGIEIVAASNYDEALVQHTLQAMRAERGETAHADVARTGERNPAPTQPSTVAHDERAPSPAEQAAAYFRPRSKPAAAAEPVVAAAASHAPLPAADVPVGPVSFAAKLAACLPPNPLEADLDGLPPLPKIAPPLPLPPEEPPVPTASQAPLLSAVNGSAAAAPENDQQLLQMRAELASMREMIEREMSRLTDERLRGSPVRAQALDLMDDYGFDAGLTRDIALQIPADTELHRGRGLMLGLLSKKLPIAPGDPLEDGGIIALVGPTGAGKTTTIAKLAAAYAAKHNARDVALVTTDTVRVGGREQLHSYGRQLGIAVHEADSDTGLAQTLERLRDYKLVLIDTAGLGQRDRNLVGQLNWLRSAGQVRTLLVLPANSHFGDLDEVVRRFSGARPQGVVLTKVDETGRLGSALSVIVDHQLPMVWLADGQRVPQDLHRANGANLVLRLDQLRREADEPCTPETIHVA
ncbi:flagellar biosynthesis protein FlhF [Pseudoxanthomonas wuyuanensis]